MNIKHLLAIGVAICLLASCKKNSNSNSNTTGSNGNTLSRLKYYVELDHLGGNNLTDSFSAAYDNDGRLISLAAPNLKFVYTYTSNSSFTLDLYENGALSIHEVNFIKGSYVDSTFQYNNTNDSTTQKYTYKGNLLISEMDYDYSAAGGAIPSNRDTYTYDNNGNMIKDVQDDGFGTINTVKVYTYTNKLLQVTTNPIYYPLLSKDLPATLTVTDGLGNAMGSVTYSYIFDSSGRVTKETDTEDNGDYVIKTYGY